MRKTIAQLNTRIQLRIQYRSWPAAPKVSVFTSCVVIRSTDRLFMNMYHLQTQKNIIEKTLPFYLNLPVQVLKVLGAIQIKEMISWVENNIHKLNWKNWMIHQS